MIKSRDINQLRPDVARNCRKFIELAAEQGLDVCITNTVRDNEYQAYLYNKGISPSKVATFHHINAGLAFDFCKNIKGHEYDDAEFFNKCGALAMKIGFKWGGEWRNKDRVHIQWDGIKHSYTDKDILKKKYPPQMPEYKGDDDMTYSEFYKMFERAMDDYRTKLRLKEADSWAEAGLADCAANGIMEQKYPQDFVNREQLAIVADRLYNKLK